MAGNDVVRSLTIQVNNGSDGDVGVGSASLTGGNWVGPGPIPGNVITAGQNSFSDGATNIFTALGGTIQLAPASGGTITITWSWPHGLGVTGGTTSSSLTGLAVTSTVINTQSNDPTLQVYISDTQSLTHALKAAAKS